MEYKRSKFQLGLKARNVTTDRTALFISKPVKCRQQRENKEDYKRKGKKRKEIREQKSREEKKRKDEKKEKKKQKKKKEKRIEENIREEKEEKLDCLKERVCILQRFYHKLMLQTTLNFKINLIVKINDVF